MPVTLRHELARKTIHLASAAVPAAYAAGLPRRWLLVALGAALAVAVTVELARHRVPRARATFERRVGALLRAHERDRWSGATWMCVAYLLAALLFARPVAVAAMLGVALGDAAAAIVGRWWGARHIAPDAAPRGKTWVGTAACAGATLLAALLVARLPLLAAAAGAVAGALAERPAGPLDDNVRIALATGGASALALLALGVTG
jgi:dolichol kinase